MSRVLGAVVSIGEGLVLGEDETVNASIVVEIAYCEAAADSCNLPDRSGLIGDVDQLESAIRGPVRVKPGGHRVGIIRPVVVHVAIGDQHIKAATITDVGQ